jgi:hypothetical protein
MTRVGYEECNDKGCFCLGDGHKPEIEMDYAKTYGTMHEAKAKAFSGYSIKPYVHQIAALISGFSQPYYDGREDPPRPLLDYGCGKGYQYLALRVHEHWGGLLPVCYDPGVVQLRTKPEGKFNGIICTDVLEHIEEADIDSVLDDIFGFAADYAFVFLAIACRPAKRKRLPDGRDVHVTIKPPQWWRKRLAKYERAGLTIVVEFDEG